MRGRILFVNLAEQGGIALYLLPAFRCRPVLNITVMMDITAKSLPRILKGIQSFVDRGDELDLRRQTAHPAHLGVIIGPPLPVIVVTLYISSRLIIPVFSASEELYDLRRILKPLVVVQIEKPFPAGFRKPCVSRLREIITPGEGNDVGRILSGYLKGLFLLSREDNDQFAVRRVKKGNDGIQTFL